MRQIIFYRSESGNCPVEEFLDSLSAKHAQKLAWVLRLIEDLEVVPTQYFKKLVNLDDIWEVRVTFGGNIFRILGFFDRPDLVILTHGFQKKSQKTPLQAIQTAEKRKRDYLKRKR
jgi:phage-related protein